MDQIHQDETSRPAGVIHRDLPLNGSGIMVLENQVKTSNGHSNHSYNIEGIVFRAVESGSIISFGPRRITNACFYLAAATALNPGADRDTILGNARLLRQSLCPRADKLAQKRAASRSYSFSKDDEMAEIEVIYAFAEDIGPIMVIFGEQKRAHFITHDNWLSEPDRQPIFIINDNHHYRALLPQ